MAAHAERSTQSQQSPHFLETFEFAWICNVMKQFGDLSNNGTGIFMILR